MSVSRASPASCSVPGSSYPHMLGRGNRVMAGFTFHGRSLCEQRGCPGPTLAQLSAMLLAASINWGGLCQVQLHPNPLQQRWRRKWQPAPVFLPGKSHGQRSLAGYSPWGHKESDMIKRLNNNPFNAEGSAVPLFGPWQWSTVLSIFPDGPSLHPCAWAHSMASVLSLPHPLKTAGI